MNWLLRFLPKEQRALLELGMRIMSSLDDSKERKAAVAYGIEMLKDGKVTVAEWAQFGKHIGIFKGPK
mgnify:CR=1 FL=1